MTEFPAGTLADAIYKRFKEEQQKNMVINLDGCY